MTYLEILTKMGRLTRNSLKPYMAFSDPRVKPILLLYGGVLFLHGILDPGISYIGIEVLGRGWEGNSIMRIPMQQGIGTFLLAHIPLYVGILVAYFMTITLIRKESKQGRNSVYRLALFTLSLLIIWGVWLNVRNILVLINAG